MSKLAIQFNESIMNPIFTQIIIRTIRKKKHIPESVPIQDYQFREGKRQYLINFKRNVKDFFLIALGIITATFGLKGFIIINNFIDGGATGVSLLVAQLSNFPVYVLLILVNIPFILLGYKTLGSNFSIKTIAAILGLSLSVALIEFPIITDDKLLVAVFGGIFLGAGIGFSVRGGAVIDGTEVLAIYLSKKFGASIGDIILVINVIIFGTAAYYLSIETAMYSMITYMVASRTLNFLVEGIEEYIGVTIVSGKSEEIRSMIIEEMGRGVTIYNGKRGFGKKMERKDLDIVYTVVTRLELNKLNTKIELIDPKAFVVMNPVKDLKGGLVKKRRLTHG